MKLYVYCVCADLDTFDKPIPGVSAATVRVLKIDDLSVLVSDLETVLATQENALAHAAVVRSVLDRTTPLPLRFGTLTTEQQLRSFITTHRVALANKLAHVRGCVEMDLKVIWQRSDSNAQPAEATGPGTAFLKEKQRELGGDEKATAQRTELSGLLRKELADLIKDESLGLRPSETVVLAAVFHLIERSKVQQYRQKIAEVLQQQRPELRFMVSGPWPPYSFANIELEFRSQFGVS